MKCRSPAQAYACVFGWWATLFATSAALPPSVSVLLTVAPSYMRSGLRIQCKWICLRVKFVKMYQNLPGVGQLLAKIWQTLMDLLDVRSIVGIFKEPSAWLLLEGCIKRSTACAGSQLVRSCFPVVAARWKLEENVWKCIFENEINKHRN